MQQANKGTQTQHQSDDPLEFTSSGTIIMVAPPPILSPQLLLAVTSITDAASGSGGGALIQDEVRNPLLRSHNRGAAGVRLEHTAGFRASRGLRGRA